MGNNKFIFNSGGKIRTLWRLVIFLAVAFTINTPLQMALQMVLHQSLLRGMLSGTISFISAVFSLYVQVKFLDKSSFTKYGLTINKQWLKEFMFGSLISFVQLLLFFIIMIFTKNITITGYFVTDSPNYSFAQGFLAEVYVLLIGACIEELFFRAFLFYIIYEALQTIIKETRQRAIFTAVITSLLFGMAHFANNGATVLSTINLAFDAALMCLPFLITGRLGMPIGIHFAWNLVQGSVFGFAISGYMAKASLISVSMPNNLLTGGVFGPEGSALLGFLDLAAILLILYWKQRNNYKNIVNPTINAQMHK